MKLWFLNLNWPGWLLVVALIVTIAATTRYRVKGTLGTALVMYLGVHWLMWPWVPVVFWIALAIGAVAMLVYDTGRFATRELQVTNAALGASSLALAVPVTMFIVSLVGWLRHLHSAWGWTGAGLVLFFLAVILVIAILKAAGRIGVRLAAGLIVAALFLAVVSGLGASLLHQNLGHSHHGQTAAPQVPASTTTVTSTAAAPSPSVTTQIKQVVVKQPVNAQKAAKQLCKVFPACKKPGALRVGTVNWKGHTETHGVNDFSGKTLKSQADVAKFLNGSSAQSKADKAQVVAAIKKAGFGQDEINRALDGSGYFAVQPTQASQMLGTTYFAGGKVRTVNGWRDIAPNDVFWVFMTQDGSIVKDAIVRADCGNSHLIKVVPLTPQSPPAPPATCMENCTSVPPCTMAASLGYKVVGCHTVKTPCLNRNGQACGPNPPFQPVQHNDPSLIDQPGGVPPKPHPLPGGPGRGHYPPTSAAPSGYNPSGGSAPGGGSDHSGTKTVAPPKPNPTPSCSVSCGTGTQTSTPPQPK